MRTPIQHTLGVLGLGEGRSIISAVLASERWCIGNICDLNENLCRERQAEFFLPRYTTRYEDLLTDPKIDTIAIYTPDPFHAAHGIAAFRAGKHVICTKPLFDPLAEAAAVRQAATAANRHLFVGQSSRFFGLCCGSAPISRPGKWARFIPWRPIITPITTTFLPSIRISRLQTTLWRLEPPRGFGALVSRPHRRGIRLGHSLQPGSVPGPEASRCDALRPDIEGRPYWPRQRLLQHSAAQRRTRQPYLLYPAGPPGRIPGRLFRVALFHRVSRRRGCDFQHGERFR